MHDSDEGYGCGAASQEASIDQAAIGILSMTPSEISVIAAGIAIKASKIDMGFIDRFSGTLIFTGRIANVQAALSSILSYLKNRLGFTICDVTRT